jgi:hypothetical protein
MAAVDVAMSKTNASFFDGAANETGLVPNTHYYKWSPYVQDLRFLLVYPITCWALVGTTSGDVFVAEIPCQDKVQ